MNLVINQLASIKCNPYIEQCGDTSGGVYNSMDPNKARLFYGVVSLADWILIGLVAWGTYDKQSVLVSKTQRKR